MENDSATDDSSDAGLVSKEQDASFEQVVQRLEEVVHQLEKGDLPLGESLSIFEEGIRLARDGSRRLDEAERRVEELLSSRGAVSTQPFAALDSHTDE